MRYITKQGNGGFHLSQANNNPPQTAIQATSRWSSFGHKLNVQGSLLSEQFHLCCYSELRADQEGLGYHVEHVENKSQNPYRTFDYNNLAASALDSSAGLSILKAQGAAAFGGHASGKQRACNMASFISCHQQDSARFFAYLSDGRIVPNKSLDAVESDRAQYTIDILNLNSPYPAGFIARVRQGSW